MIPVAPQTILIRGVNWLGDAIMTTPALLRLRERFPHSHICLLIHEKLSELWWKHPAIDEVLEFAPRDSTWKIARELRSRRFDLAIAFPNSFRSGLELFLSRAKLRVGYPGNARSILLNRIVPFPPTRVAMHKRTASEVQALLQNQNGGTAPEPNSSSSVRSSLPSATTQPIPASAHHIHHYLHLVQAVGADPAPLPPSIHVGADEIARFQSQFLAAQNPKSPRLFVGINPGAEYGPAKRWPLERFTQAALSIHQSTGCALALFGGKADRPLTEEIEKGLNTAKPGIPVFNLAGSTSLRELVAGLKCCHVLLTNDTGPMHLAAAVGTPVVVPFGSTSPEMTGPGMPGDSRHAFIRVPPPCAPCFLRECPVDFRCMKDIEITSVVRAVLDRLKP